jgi:tripartite-type tricarboxylate transporter receptor subunit TctC
MKAPVIRRTLAACGFAVLCGPAGAAADEVAEFYKGRTVTIVIAHEVGTGFDIYGRVLARHLFRHIPGQPGMVVQNIVGASGLNAANWLANVAPRDGTVLETFVHTVPFEPLFGNAAAKYDPAKLTWIGNMEESLGTCGVSKGSGIGTFEDLRQKEVVFGATGATGPLSKFALAVKNLLGARIRLVHGYKGSASVKLAIQRGEVHGVCALPISTLKSQWRDLLDSGEFKPIIQLSGRKSPELAGIPHVDDYAKTEEDRQVFGLIFGAQSLGRMFASPPDMPPARMQALRKAFMATMADKEFLADAKQTQIDIVPNTGEEVAALIARYSATPKDVVARAKRAFSAN